MKYVTRLMATLTVQGTVETNSPSTKSAEEAAKWAASCAMEEAAAAAYASAALDVSSQGTEVDILETEEVYDEHE